MKNSLIMLIAIFLIVSGAGAGENPIEIGSVEWGRDLEVALKKSTATGRPVLVLFQEVPGCIGCQDFGRDVLTIPSLVKTIENESIPVLVYNNRSGADSEILNRFREPAWNYPVIRFLNGKGLYHSRKRPGLEPWQSRYPDG